MKILALDTAASWCAAAVLDKEHDSVLGAVSENIGKGHAEVLMDHIGRALAQAALSIRDIDRVAVNVGPGSFTGVRIGVSAARGFALALDCPAIGITAFEALAFETQDKTAGKPVTVFLDAHRGEIYAQGFDAGLHPLSQPLIFSRGEAEAYARALSGDTVLAGSAAASINEACGGGFALASLEPTARIDTYARLGAKRASGDAPKPLYMRGPDAKPQVGFALPRKPAGV
ncbi:tRNA (adenosine(37)-N6)-threonylcarbamoyltransferase complex dimerization subunit type 1 TsaB [Brucella sp. BE17]|uniref:tRNA (adenosine(37)-N6)-threonylcarbamoyltransferase complex dimerization subunit type 1 TsaB n=1 Tax=Brucella sp. BE17 TaxID=3142977 RepID=UPI0031B9EB96